jgi:tetratricopeptide (TPR) repeat protein
VTVTFVGCRSEQKPEAVFSEIEKQFDLGHLTEAGEQAEKAYARYSNYPEWAAPFRVELAKVLIYQGKSADALEILQQPLPGNPEIQSEVRQKLLLSIAEARLGHMDQAEGTLLRADHQCPEGPLRAELSGARGSV